jgi:hypothetical protein
MKRMTLCLLALFLFLSIPVHAAGTQVTGLVAEQVLDSSEGTIHYSYYLPEGYDPSRSYPLVMTMPGYDMMWFGENSSGSNLNWDGFLAWTKLSEPMIVVSAQLTDWYDTSARQAIALTEYFIQNFAVDQSRVYAAGYSAGGETMSRAVSMRPDLYAAYLHGASQWDGTYAPIAENGVAVYIFMAENDEYYGSQKARSAYESLLSAYRETGLSDAEIEPLLKLDIPDNAYFHQQGIYGNYHGGGNIVFQNTDVLNWITSARKTQKAASFPDVPADAYYADAVAYVKEHGLMNGTSDTTFSPNGTTSRGMIAAILYRVAGSPETESGADFADEGSISSYAATAVDWARANGIVSGKSGNIFDPQGNATRGQAAMILKNYLEKS